MARLREHATIELVVARYQESIAWVRNVPPALAVTIYDKGHDLDAADLPGVHIERRENVGVEADTYLHHLQHRYDSLAPLTVFVQGHPFDHAHDLHSVLRSLAGGREYVDGFRWLGFIIDSDDPRGQRLFVPWSKNHDGRELDLDRFAQQLTGDAAPRWKHFYVGAQFAVTREMAHRRSREFYAQARRLAVDFPDGGHCFERFWDRVFDTDGVDPNLLGGQLCRYLKPIRRRREALARPNRRP